MAADVDLSYSGEKDHRSIAHGGTIIDLATQNPQLFIHRGPCILFLKVTKLKRRSSSSITYISLIYLPRHLIYMNLYRVKFYRNYNTTLSIVVAI